MQPSQTRNDMDREPRSMIGEVAYEEEGKRLSVAVAGELARDDLVSDVLTGILATAREHGDAVRQIHAVGEELGWAVRLDPGTAIDVVTLHPAASDTRY